MDETTKGRFCNSCCKEVIDFTLLSDAQIVKYMSKSYQNVCGRFENEQLGRSLIMKNERKLPFLKYFIHVIVPALLISNKISAQGKTVGDTIVCTPPKLINDDTLTRRIMLGKVFNETATNQRLITIIGQVIDENHSPVPFATILIKGAKRGVSANADGMFELKVSSKDKRVVLTASCVGYEPKEMQVDLKNINNDTLNISMQMTRSTMGLVGDVVVVSTRKKKILDTISNVINKFQPKANVKIYPNPVHRGDEFNINFDVENFGDYNMTMLNSSGQIIMEKKIQISSKIQTEQIICDGRLVPGIYILQIIEQLTKKNYINKIVVL